jgi:hypothetical protein
VVQSEHPLDNYFRELMRRRRKELLRKKKAALKTLQVSDNISWKEVSAFEHVAASIPRCRAKAAFKTLQMSGNADWKVFFLCLSMLLVCRQKAALKTLQVSGNCKGCC